MNQDRTIDHNESSQEEEVSQTINNSDSVDHALVSELKEKKRSARMRDIGEDIFDVMSCVNDMDITEGYNVMKKNERKHKTKKLAEQDK